ncbi:diguanylate cyclase [Halomonas sp. HNIBRBA4712]|uniref:sensor domain-containing diguanylate cyclase n=1 Tax=Halomonas sp. HNIBRBA4712 TaxID=3373087 RepID=UPI003745F2DC
MQRFLAGLVVALAIVLIGYISLSSIWTNTKEFDSDALTGRLAGELEYLVGTNAGHFPEAEDAARTDKWQPNPKPTLNLGNQPDGAWVRFRVDNATPVPLQRLLTVDWSYNLIEARVLDRASGEWSAPVRTGNFIEPSRRGVASPMLSLPITLPSGAAEVYLRLESQLPLILPLRMLDRETFHREALHDYLRMGAFFGAMLVMLFYSASLFVFIRDRSYLYYCGYLAAVILHVASIYNYGAYFLWSEWPWFSLRVDFLSIGLAFLSACMFERQFLNLKSEGRWLTRCIDMLVVYWSCVVLVSLLLPNHAHVLFIEEAGALTCITMLAIAFIVWQRGNVSAIYFFIAWLCLMTATFFLVIAMRGAVSMNFAIRAAQLMGFILEFLLLSIALAERISRERASRLKAQNALMAVQAQNNRVLEKQVALRTRQLEEANRELLTLSSTDPLTGLNNRRGFEDNFEEVGKSSLAAPVRLAFLMVDIDHFKAINDTHGHNVGDECLARVGKTLGGYSENEAGFAGRLGGEEFAVVFYDLASGQAGAMAERIRAAIAELRITTAGEVIQLTVSIGVATGVAHGDDSMSTFAEAADKALYRAKREGRNRVVLSPIPKTDSPSPSSDNTRQLQGAILPAP